MSSNPVETMRSGEAGGLASSKPGWEDFFERQIEATRRQVGWSELAAGLILVLVWCAALFLLVIAIDGWIAPLGRLARWLSLIALVSGTVVIVVRFMAPYLLKRISPEYAAKMIEDGSDGFHNSLLNYLLLRRRAEQVSPVILQSVGQRAAQDIGSVSPLEKVDYSRAIRLAFALLALFAVFVLYAILSPKSPWPTIQRVLWPGLAIPHPATVTISRVHPGDTEVLFGQKLLVSVELRGRHDPHAVRLVYSTLDGQQVDVSQPMRSEGDTNRYQLELATSSMGVQHDLRYWIQVHDAQSVEYRVTVLANPTIAVDAVDIVPPAYTELPPRRQEGRGDIEGPDGSQVTIYAKANLPIEVAYLELLRARPGDDKIPYDLVRTVELIRTSDETAQGMFHLVMDTQRLKPLFTHYQVKFRSTGDRRSELINVYPIRMIPDMPPEVKIVRPTEERIGLPINRELEFEVVAMDRDYKLSSVNLIIDKQGSRLWDQECALAIDRNQQQSRCLYRLVPQSLRLQPGDEVIVSARAADNRVSVHSGQLDPNISRSQNIVVVIEEPSLLDQPPDQSPSSEDGQPSETQSRQQTPPDKQDQRQEDSQEGDSDSTSESRSKDQPPTGDRSGKDQETGEQQADQDRRDPASSQEQTGKQESTDPRDSKQDETPPAQQNQADSGQQQQSSQKDPGTGQGSDDNTGQQQQQSSGGTGDKQDSPSTEQQTGNQQSSAGDNSTSDQRGQGEASSNAGQGSDASSSDPSSSQNQGTGRGESSSPGEADRDASPRNDTPPALDSNATDGQRMERLQDLAQRGNDQADSQQPKDQPSETDPSGTGQKQSQELPGNETDKSDNDQAAATDNNSSAKGTGSETTAGDTGQGRDENQRTEQDSAGSGQGANDQVTQRSDKSESSTGNGADQQQTDQDRRQTEGEHQGGAGTEQGRQTDAQEQDGRSGNADAQSDADRRDQEQHSGGRSGEGNDREPPDDSRTGGVGSDQQGAESEASDSRGEAGRDKDSEGGRDRQDSSTSERETPDSASGDKRQPPDGHGQSSQGSESEAGDQMSSPSSDARPSQSSGTSGEQAHERPSSDEPSSSKDSAPMARTPGGQGSGGSPRNDHSEPSREDLEYSKEATEMVLDYLRQQQENPDPKLLESMNWTADDLRDFLARWEQMRQRAQVDPDARNQYEEALQSLGLRRPESRRQSARGTQQGRERLAEDGAVMRPPANYAEQFNAFLKNVNRLRSDK